VLDTHPRAAGNPNKIFAYCLKVKNCC
jgi:hypothetical protein